MVFAGDGPQVDLDADVSLRSTIRIDNSKSPLLHFPAELRNEIYGYALGRRVWDVTGGIAHVAPEGVDPYRAATSSERLKGTNILALLETCHQVHHETASLPFSINTLYSRKIDISPFLSSLTAAQQAAVMKMRLQLFWDNGPNPFHLQNGKEKFCEKFCTVMGALPGLKQLYIEALTIMRGGYGARQDLVSEQEVREWLDKNLRAALSTKFDILIKVTNIWGL
ncbi:hypothetical protein CC86DRAFT_463152 [Ophiobolus disseminans]|uniref:DUF7730 domain-containing protein n=1 Tax=Ophiobolus disseminans TaxID=1469910 RepID=A0A6A7AD79_9PLEO|nr:hypothetical protein CC86DRAFT_463152 [Ophiobolus disseminans]